MRKLIPPHIEGIKPYEPGKPIEEVQRELGLTNVVKLASNENAYGPSPKAVRAVREKLEGINLYPVGNSFYLRRKLSEKLNLPMEKIVIGNGSCELVEIIAKTFLGFDENAVISDKAFIMYWLAVQVANGHSIIVPHRGLRHDLKAMAAAVNDKTKLIFISNPNNPTGMISPADELLELLETVPRDVVVVVDEAYYEYVADPDYPQTIPYLEKYPNLIILRTFSKVYGLAGLRIGYGLADKELLTCINRVRSPFNANSLAQAGAEAALDDEAFVQRSREENDKERQFMEDALKKRRLDYIPSHTNFVLVNFQEDGHDLYQKLLKQGVIVRPLAPYKMAKSLRITLGTHEENLRFLEALDQVL
jgi:histidinol-phosphate aminotransferase